MEIQQETYAIEFTGIELISKSLVEPIEVKDGELKFNFNFLSEIKLFPPKNNAFVLTDIKISETNENKELALFKTLCVFSFPYFDKVFKLEVDKYIIPLNLEITLKSAGISTSRGIIYSELRGTYLNNAILPLIDIATPIIAARKKNEDANKE